MSAWDHEADVVVLGSGGAGLTAALTAAAQGARVVVLEQAPTLGGTTAVSGGIVWVPAHDRDPGRDLPVVDAVAYLRAQSLGSLDEPLVEVFVRSAPHMLEFVEQRTPLQFMIVPGYLDDQPELPGGKPDGGRSFIATEFDTSTLGEWKDRITAYPEALRGVGFDVSTGRRSGGRGGYRMVLGLLDGLLQLGVEPQLGVRARELISEAGAVVGVRVDGAGGTRHIRARRGVVVATGGFEWDKDLVAAFLRGPMSGATSPPGNRGDGLRMVMALGAELANMSEAWWEPFVRLPDPANEGQTRNHGFLFDRIRPRSIMVNRAGRRFVNESYAFNAIAGPFHQLSPHAGYGNDPAWVVIDSLHFERYGAFGVAAGQPAPDWFSPAMDLASLAARTGIDGAGLKATVEAWNRDVREWRDPEFGRGQSARSGWTGDEAAASIAEGTLGPIDSPPYFAVPVTIGSIGTKGGPRTDRDGRVQHVFGGSIQGLFAAGNAMAAVTGSAYGGPGAPIGLAMTWGHRAGYAAATGGTLET